MLTSTSKFNLKAKAQELNAKAKAKANNTARTTTAMCKVSNETGRS